MANTTIQIKRSTTTAVPTSLNAGELAYSYSSNTLFIGTGDGAGTIAVGGKSFYDLINSASAGGAVSANGWTNTVWGYINTEIGTANTYANGVGAASNNWANTVAGYANTWANTQGGISNSWSNSQTTVANNFAGTMANAANAYAGSMANAANASAAATYYLKTGGTVSGDMVVTGNLTVSGLTTYTNTQTLLIGDNILTLNADLPSTSPPTENAGMTINRGNLNSNAAILWDETVDKWAFTSNDALALSTYIASTTDVTNATVSANTYAGSMANAANAFAGSMANASNVWANTVSGYSNTWSNTVAGYANTWANTQGGISNTWANTIGGVANTWANTQTGVANSWANTVGGYANNFAGTMANAANAYAGSMANAANSYAMSWANNGTNIRTGIVNVAVGGTGIISATLNGVIFGGGGNGAFQVTAAGTDGQVLVASPTGIPQFAHLNGGTF